MKSYRIVIFVTLILVASSWAASTKSKSVNLNGFETRCGWFSNPTPGNISLYDRDREWIIGVQGGYQVEGDWEWPTFASGQWVKTNVHYGYGCACLEVKVDHPSAKVLAVNNVHAKPLKLCRRDKSLKKWHGYLP